MEKIERLLDALRDMAVYLPTRTLKEGYAARLDGVAAETNKLKCAAEFNRGLAAGALHRNAEERQQLLSDMRELAISQESCDFCANLMPRANCEGSDFSCTECQEDCGCKDCYGAAKFRWRGQQPDNGWIRTVQRKPVVEFRVYRAQYPGEDPEFLVMIEDALEPTCLSFDGEDFYGFSGEERVPYRVTHWMPMPVKPEVDG